MKTTLTVLLIINLYGLVSCATKRYYFINQTMTWDNALEYCKDFYHGLSSFTNETEEQRFSEYASFNGWVGLGKEAEIQKWAGGNTPSFWHGIPSVDSCAYFSIFCGKLHFTECNAQMTFYCMTLDFVVVQQSESWEGALEYCRHHHDDLASLSTNNRMTDTFNKIQDTQTQYVWIGLRFLAGEWIWISGDDLQYEVWSSPGQPQCPAQNQRCGALDKITMTWTNRDCEEKLNFLCV